VFYLINIIKFQIAQIGRIFLILPVIFIFLVNFVCYSETIVSNNITANTVWTADNSPYIIISDVSVSENAMLTIQPGVTVSFSKGRNLYIKGLLSANGDADNKITFTGNNPSKQKGFWGAVHIEFSAKSNSSNISNTIFECSGYNNYAPIVLDARTAPNFSNIEVVNCLYSGIEIKSGVYSKNIYLKKFDLPYLVTKQLEIAENTYLEIEQNVVLKFTQNANLVVKGDLIANGTSSMPIIFTSVKDDLADNIDSDCNFYSTGNKFDWGGISLINSINSSLTNVQIKYGGGSSVTQNSLLLLENSSPIIQYTLFEESGKYGITILNNSNPDLGSGIQNSLGMNRFSGFSQNNFAILCKSEANISAKKNCWGTNDASEIEKIIYHYNDKNRYGKVDYSEFLEDCFALPSIPVLTLPEDYSENVSTSAQFVWEQSSSTIEYDFSISNDLFFGNTLLDTSGLTSTNLSIENLCYKTKYFWKVRAINDLGASDWSEIFSFTTIDTSKPDIPILLLPENNSADLACSLEFVWQNSTNTETNHIQISKDLTFSNLFFESNEIDGNTLNNIYLDVNEEYFWRVRAWNINGWSDWSEVYQFTTSPCLNQPVPLSWDYEKFTGLNSIIVITKNTNKSIGNFHLAVGDAIGVFYNQDSVLHCGGYAIITNEENIAIPVWGDNSVTNDIKDGFDFNENFKFKIWNSCCGEEMVCAAELFSGVSYFIPDTVSILKRFNSLVSAKINFNRNQWKMVSSSIAPYNSYFKSIFNNNFSIKEDDEYVFYPVQNIYKSNYWNSQNCYEIFSSKKDSVILTGTTIQPELNPIYIQARKSQIIPYYLNKTQLIETALFPILNDVLLVKDSEGNCYIPDYMFNSLEVLKPNEAYKIILKNDANFVYNSNTNQTYSNFEKKYPTHFQIHTNKFTGSNAIIVLEAEDLENGDEISVVNASNKICGVGLVENSVCVLTVYGDNLLTPLEIEGAAENELLKFIIWKKSENTEKSLNILEVRNLITNQYETILLKYKKDSFYNVFATTQATSVKDTNEADELEIFIDNEQRICILYHNNPEIKIEQIKIYDILGNEIIKVIPRDSENFESQIDINSLKDGFYLIRIKTSNGICTKRFVVF